MPSPHAIAALAFVQAECSILGRIKHGSNELWFVAAFVATKRLGFMDGRRASWFQVQRAFDIRVAGAKRTPTQSGGVAGRLRKY